MRFLVFVLALFLASCSNNYPDDPFFAELKNEFYEDCKKNEIDCPYVAIFFSVTEGKAGLCQIGVEGRGIAITSAAKYYPRAQLKALVYHEMGHCALGLGHAAQNSLSLMAPALSANIDMATVDFLSPDLFAAHKAIYQNK